MRNNLMRENSLKYLCPALVFIIGLCVYSFRVSFSGLWLDEAVEYFYSKVMFGSIEGVNESANMYERICSTYQPPLYNVLMYVWLKFFDSEFSFRLAGILTTLVGMLGIYAALLKVSNYRWASLGAMIYIFIPRIAYYALECAEYNLMLCCESWTLYFFVSFLNERNNKSLAGFFIFSCLSVYSQYGAAFFVAGLYITLLIHFFRDKHMLFKFLCATLIIGIVAVLPLLYFFLIPQMIRQESTQISHMPLVSWNNILYDFIRGIIIQAGWDLSVGHAGWNITGIVAQIMIILPFAAASLILFIAAFRYRKLFTFFLSACIISWLIYYLCVTTSFYAYNDWSGNSGFGNRYGLFLIPLWLFTLIYASSLFCKTQRQKIISVIFTLCFVAAGVIHISSGWTKDDVREVANTWYKNIGFNGTTLVHQWDDANFQFYIRHNKSYKESFQKNIITAGIWIRSADHDDVYANLKSTGIFEHDALFYVSPSGASLETFMQVMKESGYVTKRLYEGRSVLLYMHKKIQI